MRDLGKFVSTPAGDHVWRCEAELIQRVARAFSLRAFGAATLDEAFDAACKQCHAVPSLALRGDVYFFIVAYGWCQDGTT